MMTKFTETPQWKSGMNVEAYLDRLFRSQGWNVSRTTPHQERVLCLGDRIYNMDDNRYFIEYKSGLQTAATGNVFLETISVDTQNKEGWVYTCKADYIFYATLLNHKILVFQPETLRKEIEGLKSKFRVVKTGKGQNKGYNTHGVIVPLDYAIKHLALQVVDITTLPTTDIPLPDNDDSIA
jgi:hypothetical protein